MKKDILFEQDARKKLLSGVDKICNAVKSTLGAGGRSVIFENVPNIPEVTKDGVTVASAIFLEDHYENMGAQLIKQVATKTVNMAGDGTTTSCVLAQALIRKGMELIDEGGNPVEIANTIRKETENAIEKIKKISIPIKGDWAKVRQVAVISANGDEKHAGMIVDAMEKIGEDGVLMIEQGNGLETKMEVVKGLSFDSGYLSPFFINTPKNECVLEDPYIFITHETIAYLTDTLPAMKIASNKQKPVLFICNNADGEGFSVLIVNRTKGGFPLCAVNAPSFGERRKEYLLDISCMTGGTIMGADYGIDMKNCVEEYLGRADKVVITKDGCTIIGGKGDATKIDERIVAIKDAIEKEESDELKAELKQRLAKLSGGIAVMSVGGHSEASIRELKDRCDDAMHATRAAIEGGIVPGGGVAYLNSSDFEGIVASVLAEPFKQIMVNAGIDPMEAIDRVDKMGDGINVRTNEVVNMVESGIIDATKVTISALQNASDVACLMLTSNAVVVLK